MNNIYLIGFMGAGKSTVGRLISKKMSRPFFDTDKLIEQKSGLTIPKIFRESGEAVFRELEAEIVKEVAKKTAVVVALGGGAVINNKSWKALKNSGTIFYLKWPDNILMERILHSQHRPLVTEADMSERKDALQKKLDSRQERYHEAHHVINCYEGMPADETANLIIQIMEKK